MIFLIFVMFYNIMEIGKNIGFDVVKSKAF